MFLTSLSKK